MQKINLYFLLFIVTIFNISCASINSNEQDIAIMPYEQRQDGTYYTADDQVKTATGGFAGTGNINRSKLLDANSA